MPTVRLKPYEKTLVIGIPNRNNRISHPRENPRKTFDCTIGNRNGQHSYRAERRNTGPPLFHRVVKDFVIQAGDPNSKQAPGGKILGEGGPGYMLAPEIDLPFQYHKRGAVAMARENDANNPDRLSNGSQFYIVWGKKYRPRELAFAWTALKGGVYGDFETNREMEQEYLTTGGTPGLDGGYTVFGEVIEGLNVVENIQSTATDSHDRPQTDIVILHAVVEQKSKKAGTTGKRQHLPGLY